MRIRDNGDYGEACYELAIPGIGGDNSWPCKICISGHIRGHTLYIIRALRTNYKFLTLVHVANYKFVKVA